ncbi:Shiga toxin A subunit [Cronobacter turicensis]|nr:Shiga toxin A subunit [Cronobacter turicensis]
MKRLLFCLISAIPVISYSKNHDCTIVGASLESSLFSAIGDELNIDITAIDRAKTRVEHLYTAPVSKTYAAALAKTDYAANTSAGRLSLSEGDYFASYHGNHTQSVTAKYTYFNKDNKKDVFIASGLINRDECSVRFNGYLTLSREF